MDKKNHISCPQCLHENLIDDKSCSLCGHTLKSTEVHDANHSNVAKQFIHSELTIDPDEQIAQTNDADKTVAPVETTQNTSSAIREKHTFHLAGDLAHFEILEILGQGGMGAVYHAKDRILQRDVALKLLRPLAASSLINTDALLDEARMASKLNHPNIVTIYDVARTENSNYIVMEWVDGQSLEQLIPDEGFKLETALDYACQIVDGLASAHQKYIIHRDIKPQNIMLNTENSIKILDFGIAGLVKPRGVEHENNSINNIKQAPQQATGTPSYMSPEQTQGLNLDQRTDIFSFGIVLYQMLCGKRPYVGENLTAIKQAIYEGKHIPIQQQIPDLPSQIAHLVEKMLAKKKDERWQSSAELSIHLHEIHQALTHKKNWWQRQHLLTKTAVLLPFVLALGWSAKEIIFPASTQQLIERQLQEATKIAILPFENISGDPLIQLFGDGLTVNLGTDLSAIAGELGNTWIVPSTEISRMTDQSPKAVADKYGVNLILTGSIQHMGSTRLLVLNLLNGQTGQQVKTAEVSINAEQLFQGHGLIRSQALALLNWTIPDNLADKFQLQRPQLDGAYKEYVQGRGYLYRYDHEGNLNKAMNAFLSAINIDANYEEAYVGLAEVKLNQFIKSKDASWLDKMSETIELLRTINSNNTQIDYLSAEIAMKRGNYEGAAKLYQSSIKQNPNYIKAQIGLASAFNKIGKINEAEEVYQAASEQSPNNWNVIAHYGIFNFQNGQYLKALNHFKKLTQISPNNHYGYRNTAAVYYALGDMENAILFTQSAIKLEPSDKAYANLGTMLFSEKRYQEAIDVYQMAIELKNNNFLHWGNLADAYKLNNDDKRFVCYENAVKFAKESLQINPNYSLAQATLAYYLSNLSRDDEAISFAKKINQQNSGLENFLVATAYDQMNLINKSMEHLQIAINKNYSLEEIRNTPFLEHSRSNKRFHELVK